MGHVDKYFSSLGGGTKVAFIKNGITQEVRVYYHDKNEWDIRVAEEKEWKSQGEEYNTKFIK